MLLYTTKEVVSERLWLDIQESESLSLIQRATKIIDSYLGKNLWVHSVRELVDGTGTQRLYTKNIPVSKESVVITHIWASGYNYEVMYVDWYTIWLSAHTLKGKKLYYIDYETWHTTPPSDIEEICLSLIASFKFLEGEKSKKIKAYIDENIVSKKIDSLSVTYAKSGEGTMNPMDILAPHLNIHAVLQKYRSFIWVT